MRIRRDTRDVNPACTEMNEEKDVVGDQPETRLYLRGEEIGSYQNVHVISSLTVVPSYRMTVMASCAKTQPESICGAVIVTEGSRRKDSRSDAT